MGQSTEERAVKKVFTRIIPLLMAGSVFNFLDRVNLGFAALQMNQALSIGQTTFGVAAGLTLVSYCLCEVPSNLALQRYGGRKWLSRILLTWGVVSASTAFATGGISLGAIRFVLGAMEAGFTPGAILLISLWVPRALRGRAMGLFLGSQLIAVVLGAPLSGVVMERLDGFASLAGWQWLFVIEGIPTAVLGIIYLFFLSDSPSHAAWLTVEEKAALIERLRVDEENAPDLENLSIGKILWKAFSSRSIMLLSFCYVCLTMSAYGIAFFLPQLVRESGFSIGITGWIVAIPSLLAAVGTFAWSYWSDRTERRERVTSFAFAGLALGLVGMAILGTPTLLVATACFATISMWGVTVSFWPIPTTIIEPASLRPVGLATVNSIGTLGGFVSPIMFGLIRDQTGSYNVALLTLAAFAAIGAISMLGNRPARNSFPRPQATV